MNEFIYLALVTIIPYLIGSFNFSIFLSKIIAGEDVRKKGSGNAGATNMLRNYGKKMAIATLILDILKGVLVLLAYRAFLASDIAAHSQIYSAGEYIAGVFVVLGHNFPIYFGFKGGKGVATSLGVILMLDWRIGIVAAVIAVTIMAITRYVSLGSIIGALLYVILEIIKAVLTDEFSPIKLICVVILGGLLVVRHTSNIKRLLDGTENKLGAKKKAQDVTESDRKDG